MATRAAAMTPIDLVIFDCDGVLIDSEVISARILIAQLGRVGVHVDFPYVQKHFLGRSWTKVAAEVRISYGLDLDSDFEEQYRSDLLEAFETELQSVHGVETVIDKLVAQLPRDRFLQLLDLFIDEFHHLAGLQVDQVIVVLVPDFLVARATVAEVVPLDDAGFLEQAHGAVDRCQRNPWIFG